MYIDDSPQPFRSKGALSSCATGLSSVPLGLPLVQTDNSATVKRASRTDCSKTDSECRPPTEAFGETVSDSHLLPVSQTKDTLRSPLSTHFVHVSV